ncbi:MAG TPA: glycosyltransferase family 2 protein, partial [Bacteroidota bacterium]|nr:glycosyltransferase family 2 protein [Bacteroidota bacterium]
ESDSAILLGATGGVYGIRRALFVPLPLDRSVSDDFLTSIQVVKKGFRMEYAPDARAYEFTSGSIRKEFLRKVRIGAQNFAGISEFIPLLSPKAGFVAFALWSHKIIRWFVPHLALVAFIATAVLAAHSHFYASLLLWESGCLGLALVGALADLARVRIGFLSLPFYVVAMNLALFVGFLKYVFGKQRSTWDVFR